MPIIGTKESMVQVKKKEIRQAILDSAYDLFSERGYHSTTLQEIADLTGIGVSSVYSYFPSKIDLLYAVLVPWYKEAFERLEKRVNKQKDNREKLRTIMLGVWRDMPEENVGLVNSLMEALASADPKKPKPAPLLKWTEDRLMDMLKGVLPDNGFDYEVLPNLFMMANDGFVINRRLNDLRDIERLCNAMCDIILGPAAKG